MGKEDLSISGEINKIYGFNEPRHKVNYTAEDREKDKERYEKHKKGLIRDHIRGRRKIPFATSRVLDRKITA